MKSTSIKKELLSWCIDHPNEELPESLRQHLQDDELRQLWKKYQKWSQCLREEITWTPNDDFYERLAAQAMLEKRRAALTDSTRKDLFPDPVGLWSFFTQPINRYSFALILVLLLVIPLGYYTLTLYQTIGVCQHAKGKVLSMDDTNRVITKHDSIYRGMTLQTTSDSESILYLESHCEIVLAPRSRITLIDKHNVRLDLGKAFFDVSPGDHQFKVEVPHGTIRVLGTAFSIEAARNISRVTVARGVVQVNDGQQTSRVSQGQESMMWPQKAMKIRPAQNIQSTFRWVNKIRDRYNQEELRTYYPSLAVPTPTKP